MEYNHVIISNIKQYRKNIHYHFLYQQCQVTAGIYMYLISQFIILTYSGVINLYCNRKFMRIYNKNRNQSNP